MKSQDSHEVALLAAQLRRMAYQLKEAADKIEKSVQEHRQEKEKSNGR